MLVLGKGNCHHPFFPEEEAKLRDIILARRANNEPCGGEFIRATMMKLVNANNPKGILKYLQYISISSL